jgi:hypothetical protein
MVQACVAVLCGHGAKRLWERMAKWQGGQPSPSRVIAGGGLFALMLIEVAQAPLVPMRLSIHPVYQAIAEDGRGGAILDAPVGYSRQTTRIHAGWSMFLQTLHNHPLMGGYAQFDTRERLAFLDENPVLAVFTDQPVPVAANGWKDVATFRSFLHRNGITWVVIRKILRDPICDRQRVPGWSLGKLITLVAPAAVNGELRSFWNWPVYCGDWDGARMQEADALARDTLGDPVWDDDVLVAYRVP